MSDQKEPSILCTDTESPNEKGITRYTKDLLIALHKSPLVTKPTTMPPLSIWFGDEAAQADKDIINGPTLVLVFDKHQDMSPARTNTTSQNNGTRRTDENASRQPWTARSRLHLDDQRKKNNKNVRGIPRTGEKSSLRRDKDRQDDMPSPTNGRSRSLRTPRNDEASRSAKSSTVPEWMDYRPDDVQESSSNTSRDLEAWKSSMKQRENENHANDLIQDDSVEDHSSHQSHPSHPSTSVESTRPSQQSLETYPLVSRTQSTGTGGSRFAKFFAKDEALHPSPQSPTEEKQQPSHPSYSPFPPQSSHSFQPRSISLDDLFVNSPSHGRAGQSRQPMMSEEDILRSMASMTPPSQADHPVEKDDSYRRVLHILSQPKPSVSLQESKSTSHVSHQDLDRLPLTSRQPMDDPRRDPPPGLAPPPSDMIPDQSTLRSPLNNVSPSVKNRNTPPKFHGSLPTSVLRHMTAHGSAGQRSPSMASSQSPRSSHFQPTAGSSSGSPTATSNPSPRAIPPNLGLDPRHAQGMPLMGNGSNIYPPYPNPYPHPPGASSFPMMPNGQMGNGYDPMLHPMRPPFSHPGMERPFMPPHLMMAPPPPPPPIPGAHPMMPSQPMPPFMQGQIPMHMAHPMNHVGMQPPFTHHDPQRPQQ